jgi:hypothetical protein
MPLPWQREQKYCEKSLCEFGSIEIKILIDDSLLREKLYSSLWENCNECPIEINAIYRSYGLFRCGFAESVPRKPTCNEVDVMWRDKYEVGYWDEWILDMWCVFGFFFFRVSLCSANLRVLARKRIVNVYEKVSTKRHMYRSRVIAAKIWSDSLRVAVRYESFASCRAPWNGKIVPENNFGELERKTYVRTRANVMALDVQMNDDGIKLENPILSKTKTVVCCTTNIYKSIVHIRNHVVPFISLRHSSSKINSTTIDCTCHIGGCIRGRKETVCQSGR